MTQIVNNNRLTFIITENGLHKIAEALSDNTKEIVLSSIKLGNSDYYLPYEEQTTLNSPISNAEFPLIDKALLEDELTVSLFSIIPETFGGYDITEVGIYGEDDQGEYLFAVSTQQPFVKPSTANNYYISIDYYAFLKSQNLADAYDQIVIKPNTQLVTQKHIEEFLSTVLFTQANLMDQIGHNSQTIGLNRDSEIYNALSENRKMFGRMANSSNYTTFATALIQGFIYGYWVFDPTAPFSNAIEISDIGPNGNNISLSTTINNFESSYMGSVPALTIDSDKYFYLDARNCPSFVSNSGDTDFSMYFIVEPLENSETRTLLARSDYALHKHVFEIQELSDGSLSVKFFQTSTDYKTFKSPIRVVPNSRHCIAISYENATSVKCYINGINIPMVPETTGNYQKMGTGRAEIYCFEYDGNYIWANSSTTPTMLYESDGTFYEGDTWAIDEGQVYFNSNQATYYSDGNKTLVMLNMTSCIIDSNGNPSAPINSKVSNIVIATKASTDIQLRNLSLLLMGSAGLSPCIIPSPLNLGA